MSAWHDRVGDLTLFEALTGGAFDVKTGNIAGNLTKIFQKSQMPGGLPGGGWVILELTGTLEDVLYLPTLTPNVSVKSKLRHPPRAYPGHLTSFPAREEGI